MTLGGMTTRIRAGSLGPNEAALVVDTQSSRTMSIFNKNRKFAVRVEPANRARLFLRKQQATIFRADDTVGIVGSLPDELPLGTSRDDPWDCSNCHVPLRGRLWKTPLSSGVRLLAGIHLT